MRIAGFGFNTPPLSGSNQSLIKFLKNQNQSSGFTITIPAGSRSLWLDFKWISGTPTISAEWTVTHAVILDSTLITDGNPILLDLQSIMDLGH